MSEMPARDVCATELFWHLVEEKGKVSPATGKQTFVKPFTMLETTWERFKTVRNATGRMQSDYTLAPTPAEADLDAMAEANIEPTCHPQVQCVVRPEMPARTLTRARAQTHETHIRTRTAHTQVLYDTSLDLTFSDEMPALKAKVDRGQQARHAGGTATNYGRGHVRRQFRTLDMSRARLKQLNVPHRLVDIGVRAYMCAFVRAYE